MVSRYENHFTSNIPVSTRLAIKAYILHLASHGLMKANSVENPTVKAKAFFPPI